MYTEKEARLCEEFKENEPTCVNTIIMMELSITSTLTVP